MRIHHIILLRPYNCNIRFGQARNYRVPLYCVIHTMNISLSMIYENLSIIFQIQSQKPWSRKFSGRTPIWHTLFQRIYPMAFKTVLCIIHCRLYLTLHYWNIFSWIMIDSGGLNIVHEKSQKRSSVHDCQDIVMAVQRKVNLPLEEWNRVRMSVSVWSASCRHVRSLEASRELLDTGGSRGGNLSSLPPNMSQYNHHGGYSA